MTTPLCFVDTETDGVHPGRKPWEIAMIRREPDGTEREMQCFIAIDLATADPFGLSVGRFYDRHPLGRRLSRGPGAAGSARQKAVKDAAYLVAEFTHGAHIVGAVPNFDTEILAGLLREVGFTPAWHYHLVDVENLAVGYLAGCGQQLQPPWSSDAITAALGLPPVADADRHTALGDARWAKAIYDRVLQVGKA
jgi:hypothetical protein